MAPVPCGATKSVGSLEVGKQADIAVFEVADTGKFPIIWCEPLLDDRDAWSRNPCRRTSHNLTFPIGSKEGAPPEDRAAQAKQSARRIFYRFVAAICLTVMILGKAGGLSGYDAVVTGLWVGAFLWFARQVRNYRKEHAVTATIEHPIRLYRRRRNLMKEHAAPNMKPMIGPQWPVKTLSGVTKAAATEAPPCQRATRQSPRNLTARLAKHQGRRSCQAIRKRGFVYNGRRCRTASRNCRTLGGQAG